MIVQSGSKAKAFIEEIIHHFQRFVILEGGFSFRKIEPIGSTKISNTKIMR
jgi:hypothetical protein